MTTTTTPATTVLERALALRGVTSQEAAESERQRTLTPALVDAMWASGLMQAMNPAEAGGIEPTFADMIDTWIELACQDGSLGWVGIANLPSAAAAAVYLPDAGFDEVFTANDHRVTMGGQFFPNGQGVAADGGYRITGAWNFGSGTGHSEYVAAGFIPMDGDEIRWASDGIPVLQVALVPRREVTFTDGWHVQGLKGTGSFDYELHDVFVPEHRTFPLFTREPLRGGAPMYRTGIMGMTAAGHAGWALGVAKSTLDDVRELAASKTRMGEPTTLAGKASFQKGLTHHTAMWRAARLLVLDAFAGAEAALAAGDELTATMRADLRVAAVYATDAAREIVHWAHLAAGTSAIREGSRLERAFRDMYTGTQHAFISEKVAADAAQVWLGITPDPIGL